MSNVRQAAFGIMVGFTAQRTIAALFAGFQLAMTQPIRIDDAVIVENEWGRIEEITLTYVVVRILGPAPAHRAAELFYRVRAEMRAHPPRDDGRQKNIDRE